MNDDIPQWAKERARHLTDCEAQPHADRGVPLDRYAVASVIHEAFARYIAEHEEPPVDPLLIEAREVVAATQTSPRFMGELRRGQHDGCYTMEVALAALKRGMELAK